MAFSVNFLWVCSSLVARTLFFELFSSKILRARQARGALGDAELVALEVGRGSQGLGGGDLLGGAGLMVLGQGVLLGDGLSDDLVRSILGDLNAELGGLHVLQVLDVAPHLLVRGVLDQEAVGVDDF